MKLANTMTFLRRTLGLLVAALVLISPLGLSADTRHNTGQRVWTFSDTLAGAITVGPGAWDNSVVQNAGSVACASATDPVVGSGNVLKCTAGALDGSTVGKSHLSKYFPKAGKGSRITVELDIHVVTQASTGLQMIDIECRICYSTNPGIRMGTSSDTWRLERSKLAVVDPGTANTGVASTDGAWQHIKWEQTLGDATSGFVWIYFDNATTPQAAAFLLNMPLYINSAGLFTSEGLDAVQVGITSNSTAGARDVYVKNLRIIVFYAGHGSI